jgi:hypothetical protein
MVSESGTLESLEAKAPILFILGGVLYGIGTVGLIITTYTGTSFGMDTTFAALGKVLVPLGLLGLYPALVERRPYLSRAAAVVAVIPAACWSLAFVGGGILEPAGILDGAPGPLALAPFVGFIGLYVAFALFGIASLLADVHPRALAVLLLVYPAMFPLWMTVLSGVPDFVSGVYAVVIFAAIGVVLWNADVAGAEPEVPAEPTA